jgi:hypothetical protein
MPSSDSLQAVDSGMLSQKLFVKLHGPHNNIQYITTHCPALNLCFLMNLCGLFSKTTYHQYGSVAHRALVSHDIEI